MDLFGKDGFLPNLEKYQKRQYAWHYGRPCAAVGDSGTAAAATLMSLDAR